MRHTKADLEAALHQILCAEDRIEEQRARLARLLRDGHPTEYAEDLLRVLKQYRELLQEHLAAITTPAASVNLVNSLADESEDDWDS
jgi:hypothetical protein